MVLKDWLPFFPPVGTPFLLRSEGTETPVRVESYPCECRGPDLPHEHYFIRLRGLSRRDRIAITRSSAREPSYELEIAVEPDRQ